MLYSNNDDQHGFRIKIEKIAGEDGPSYRASSMGLETNGQSEATAVSSLKKALYEATISGKIATKRIA